ncbi:MAG: site-specific DNA-methyltransferase [Desulfobacterales bacterium]|nr:site-specific DNA-methyltransferase [Desulfobacterales bacterium]
MINWYNMDCMDFMRDVPDNKYDLAIVDPPYGIGWDGDNLKEYNSTSCESWKHRKPKGYTEKKWDSEKPPIEYFEDLQRISKNQIIWGGNYFTNMLEVTGSWIVWDKQVVMPTLSDGELAWCSINNSVKIARFLWAGYLKCEKTNRIHPTQKPVELYRWLLNNYAKPGDKIIDTHGGSGSIALACDVEGFDLDIIELDKEYFEDAKKRFEIHKEQLTLFDNV